MLAQTPQRHRTAPAHPNRPAAPGLVIRVADPAVRLGKQRKAKKGEHDGLSAVSGRCDACESAVDRPVLWFTHVQIPPKHKYKIRHQILKKCEFALEQTLNLCHRKKTGLPLCLLQGPDFAYWLMLRLREHFPEVFYVDMEQPLHAWFFDNTEIDMLQWEKVHAFTIFKNCGLEPSHHSLGVQRPVLQNLFSERIPKDFFSLTTSQ